MYEDTGGQNTTAALLRGAQDGDGRARAALVHRMEPLLRRFAHARLPPDLRRHEDTGDLVQRTWLRVLERLPQIRPDAPGAFFAYLRTALVNGLRESLRRDGAAPVTAGAEWVERIPVESGLALEDCVEYERSLDRLDPGARALVLMRFEFGMSFSEIGAELDAAPDAVRMRLRRALLRMAGDASHDDI